MSLPPRLRRWADRLADEGHEVYVTLTRNRRAMVRLQQISRKKTDLRLHEAFAEAPMSVLRDLARTITHRDREAWRRVSVYAQNIEIPEHCRREVPTQTRGVFFDLEKELAFVKQKYFSPDLEARITWGKLGAPPRRRKRRSIRFGSWNEDEKLIRVHPLLDQEWVPREFIRYLIYHEICHTVCKPRVDQHGRHLSHHADFRALERQYPDFQKMEELSKSIFERLIRERR